MNKKKIYPKKHILIAFYGVSGSGKSMLVNMLKDHFANITLYRKDCTRLPRKGETKDGTPEMNFVKSLTPKKDYLFTYRQYMDIGME